MKKLSQIEKVSNNLVKAFLKNKIIAPIPSKFVKNSKVSEQLRKLCESKIKKPVIKSPKSNNNKLYFQLF